MPLMNWDTSLDIGVEEMNAEHQEILSLMNRVFDAHEAGQTGAPILAAIDELAKVCVAHFKDEENYMEQIGFKELPQHKKIHERLLTKLSLHAEEIKAADGKVDEAFFNFLRFWLSAHIKGIDSKYAEHARLKKAG